MFGSRKLPEYIYRTFEFNNRLVNISRRYSIEKQEVGMSRIGKMPIAIPAGVTVDIAENNKVTVKDQKEH